jgi:hypothetical protein
MRDGILRSNSPHFNIAFWDIFHIVLAKYKSPKYKIIEFERNCKKRFKIISNCIVSTMEE